MAGQRAGRATTPRNVATLVAAALSLADFAAAGHTLRGAGSLAASGAQPAATPSGSAAGSNPLLPPPGDLPCFAEVRPEHAVPAVEQRLRESEAAFQAIEARLTSALANSSAPIKYEDFVLPLEDLYDSANYPWEMVTFLRSVQDSAELREAAARLEPQMVQFSQRVGQSEPIGLAFSRLRNAPQFQELPEARQRIVERELLDRQLGGYGLPGARKEEFNSLQSQLSNLSTVFNNNLFDATAAWNLTVFDSCQVTGIPERALTAAAQAAERAGHAGASVSRGPWMFTLDAPVLGPVLMYAEDRALREQLYRAASTVASHGPFDNTDIVAQILDLRQHKAELLGYDSYADLSMASMMASKPEVHDLLQNVRVAARPAAEQDDAQLREFAANRHNLSDVRPWDLDFYSERMRQETYGLDVEALREYFAYPRVVAGLFALCARLFGVDIQAAASDDEVAAAARWHPDVELYRVARQGILLGHVFIDPYSRPHEKESGAFLSPLVPRKRSGDFLRLPAGAIITNFPPPTEGAASDSLLSLDEVRTLFHEFGHALQWVLTTQSETPVAGMPLEWDAVEVASQFMEYWVAEDDRTLLSLAWHRATGEGLPPGTVDQIRVGRHFQAGTGMLFQVYLATLDFAVHEGGRRGADATLTEQEVAQQVLVVQPLPESRRLCRFGHVFAGGYAAGYYSYLWSDVLSADAFSAFEEAGGLEDDGAAYAMGRRWADTVLAMGGGRDPSQVFVDFRGRPPSAAALLRYSGLAPA